MLRIQSSLNYVDFTSVAGKACLRDLVECVEQIRRLPKKEKKKNETFKKVFDIPDNYFTRLFADKMAGNVTFEDFQRAKAVSDRFYAIIELEDQKNQTHRLLEQLGLLGELGGALLHAQNAHPNKRPSLQRNS